MTEPEFSDPGASLDPSDRDIEAPDADALEQRTPVDPAQADPRPQPSRSLEAPDWDALEQAQIVELDEEY